MKVNSSARPGRAQFLCLAILAAFAIPLFAVRGGTCTPPPAGLVGWWPAEGNANDIIGGDNGSLQGGATFAAGKVSLGFRLDGTNGYVQIPDSAALKPTNVTVEAWVWLDPGLPSQNGGEQIVFKKNTWSAWFEGYSLLKGTIDNGNGTYSDRFQFCVSRYGNQVAINSQTIAQRGVWYHVAGTYDGNQSKLYVNGVLEASATPGFPLDYDTTPIFIGTSGTWAPYLSMFGGIIDEASIYNRALATNEIAAIYNAGSAGKCLDNCTPPPSGIISWWPAEGNANDIVGTNNGSLIGTVTFTNGEVGQGFYFDGGANGIVVQDAPELNFNSNQDLSIDAWIQPLTQPGNDYDIIDVLDKRVAPALNIQLGYDLFLEGGVLSFQMADVLAVNSFNNFSAGPDLRDGNFHHVAVTVQRNSSSGGRFYIDGQLAGTFDPTVCPGDLSNAGPLLIGDHPTPGFQASYHGIIDELSLYRRALTSNEISAIYNAGSAGKCTSSQSGVPGISSFAPANGAGGTLVTISGANFSATASANIVYFGAVRANVLVASPTSLTVLVPSGATYAPVTVTVNGLTASSSQFFEPTFTGNGSNLTTDSFAPSFNLPGANGPQSMVIADLDGDGKPDLAFVNGYSHLISIYRNIGTNGALLGAGSFASRLDLNPATNGVIGDSYRLRAVDLDGDGKLDLIVCDVNSDHITIFHNLAAPGSLTANSFEAPFTLTTSYDTRFATGADLDGDGRVDIVALNYGAKTISIFKNIGVSGTLNANSFAPPVMLAAPGGPYEVAIADLDGDGKPDLAVANSDSGNVTVYQNLATPGVVTSNSFAPLVELSGGGGNTETIIALDLDGDGKLDLVTGSGTGDSVNIFRNISNGGLLTTNSFEAHVDFGTAGWTHTVSVADFNGDGKPDVGVVGELNSYMAIFQNATTPGSFTVNSFAPRVDFGTGWNAWGIAAGDLDGDGRPDIVFGNYYDNTITIYQNQMPFGTVPICAPVPSGLVAWWRAEGDPADEVSGTTGAVENVTYAGGEAGQGFVFNPAGGTTRISIPDQPAFILTNSLSIEGWIYPTGPGWTIFWRGDDRGGLDPYFLQMNPDDGNTLQFVVEQESPNTAAIVETSPLAFNQWYHVAATLDGVSGTMSIYTNGILAAQTSTTVRPFANLVAADDAAIGIGNVGSHGFDHPFIGKIDEIALYSRALSVPEIQSIYNAGSAGKCLSSVAPVIVVQPTNFVATVNGLAAFSVVAYGSAPLFYQWSLNGTTVDGATNATLTLSNVQPAQAGNYSVVVSNYVNMTVSSNALLTVYVPAIPPSILSQTPNQVVLLGSTATFSVSVSGSDPLSYFWQRDGVLISGATNASYSLLNAQLSDSGSKFSCLVTNAYGSAGSTNASLKVIDTLANDLYSGAIVITSASYTNSQSTLKASSFGDPVPDCVDGFGHGVWYQFTAPVAGLLIVDTFGSDFDTGLAIYTGSPDALTEVACNDDTAGVTSQVTIPTAAGTTYSILVGGYGSDAGNLVLHLNHLTPPAFMIQPTNQNVVAGSNATFSVVLAGTRPLSYQWLLDGNPLSDSAHYGGSTTPALTVSNVTTADAVANFSVIVTNILGSVISSTASLNVLSITTQPVGRSVPPGLPTTFTAVASPSPAPAYQWQLNGTNIPGATGASYTIPAVGTNDLGFYHLLAIYPVGVAVSTDAQLTFGPVAAWGRNFDNECLPPPGLSNVMAVAGNFGASFAVRTDGTIASWGVQINIPSSASNVVAITTSDPSQNYALRSDGTVFGWPVIAAPVLSNIVSIAAGYDFAYALRAEGTLTNIYLGKKVVFPAGLNHLTAIACGYSSALALRSDGTVVTAGLDGITNPPAGLNNVIAIAAGYSYAMALKANGTVVAWGSGSGTNLPADMTNIVAISAGNYPFIENSGLAIRSNGTVVAWGDNNFGEKFPPDALSSLISIAVSTPAYHGLALVNDGSPQILHPPVGLTAYAGRDVTLQGSAAGAAPLSYQWLLNGANIPGATNTSLLISNVQAGNAGNYQLFVSNRVNTALSLAAPLNVVSNSVLTFLSQPVSQTNYQGSKATLGVTVLGSGPLRYQWSYSTNNQIFTAVAGATNDSLVFDPAFAGQSGYYRVVVSNEFNFVTSSSTYLRVLFAKSWGYLAKDPPFDVTNAVAIAVGTVQQGSPLGHYLALKSDGKISSWSGGFSPYGETNVAALSNSFVTAIAAGFQDSLALKSDGTVYAWGYGVYGETNVPSGLNGITAIACGDYHDLALKSDGTVAGWGQSTYQQTTNAAATNVVAIAAGGQDSIALRADGTVVTWGSFGGGQHPLPFGVTNIVAVAAGGQHYLALRANGTVVGWGNNPYGQTTIPAGISNVVAISAGANHSVLLRNDGTVVTLGAYAGQTTLGAPSDLANVIAIASSGDHDLALFGTRKPVFTVQPWNRAVPVNSTTNITLAAKCAGVQPVRYQWQLNGTNVLHATNDTLILTSLRFGPNVIFPTGVYQLIASNAYGVVASKFAKITTFIPLADALDTPADGKGNYLYNWTTSGNAPWFGETNITHDGVDAAQSGGIGALQETILQTTVGTNWSGRYTFWWKVSSEQDFDFLEFRVNGITQTNISGQVDWQPVSIPVAIGTNVLQWRYYKDVSFDFGQDAGWVDQFAFIPDPPLITVQPVSQTVNFGTNVTLQVTAIGPINSPYYGLSTLRYQWRQNGIPVGGNSSSLVLNNVGRAQNGTYSVTVTNFTIPNNSIVSSNAVLKVLVPQLVGSPVLLPDGSFQLTSTDADGGLLQPSDLANFEAQTSTNLMDWVTLPGALTLTNGMLLLQDTTLPNCPARFYRLLEH